MLIGESFFVSSLDAKLSSTKDYASKRGRQLNRLFSVVHDKPNGGWLVTRTA